MSEPASPPVSLTRFLATGRNGPRGDDVNMRRVHQRVPVSPGSRREVEQATCYHRAHDTVQ